ncbi:MAG: NADH:ubiquinone reductase (Na(+)-transporting) subunit E, partial [Deltaproteobacteria bacterium]|nr:NADH:ubiquinone reductase (Na(+)-transporting) subunit E [Deltaproteobacteria bacterium]
MGEVDTGTLFFAAIFTNNILLTNFLGLCPFLAVSRELRSALGLGVAVVFVMTSTAVLNYLVYTYVLLPLNLDHFRYIIFIVIIAAFVQL